MWQKLINKHNKMNKKTYEVAVTNRDEYVRTDVRDPKEM